MTRIIEQYGKAYDASLILEGNIIGLKTQIDPRLAFKIQYSADIAAYEGWHVKNPELEELRRWCRKHAKFNYRWSQALRYDMMHETRILFFLDKAPAMLFKLQFA